ncbi:MAG: hypothetical protein M3P18_02565 [Actinomycetota bacterium]|nr:hypothetical protein [Actinomycetota bacterium]
MRFRGDAGESLIEIVVTIVVIGGAVTALLAALATAALSSATHRHLVTADTVMRSYAEATKIAVRRDCGSGLTSYSLSSYAAPAPYNASQTPQPQNCLAKTTVRRVTLTVTGPGAPTTMQIDVRTP